MKIAVFGDWHGNILFAERALDYVSRNHPEIDHIFHVGDFLPILRIDNYLQDISKLLNQYGMMKAFIIRGNHDNPHYIFDLPKDSNGFYESCDNVKFLPAGVHSFHGVRVAVLGGAYSVDQEWRIQNFDWWVEELPTEEDYDIVIKESAGHNVRLMLTHDTVRSVNPPSSMILPDRITIPANEVREKIERVVDIVKPDLLVHGHWHVRNEDISENGTPVIGLASDSAYDVRENLIILDVERS